MDDRWAFDLDDPRPRPSFRRVAEMTGPITGRDSDSTRVDHDPHRDIYTFDRPPVSEVVCGVGFANPEKLTVAEIGRYWSKIAAEYPRHEIAVALPPPGASFDMTPLLAPRILLRNSNGTHLVQAQQNWFFFNWVRTRGNPDYPRYRKVYAAFDQEFQRFQDYLDERGIGRISAYHQFRLTYVNRIPRSEGWGSHDELRRFFPDFFAAWPSHRRTHAPVGVAVQFGLEVEAGRLDISIRNGQTRDEPEEAFVAELSVISPVAPREPSAMAPWFGSAREAIVTTFFDITSAEAHQKWRLHE